MARMYMLTVIEPEAISCFMCYHLSYNQIVKNVVGGTEF